MLVRDSDDEYVSVTTTIIGDGHGLDEGGVTADLYFMSGDVRKMKKADRTLRKIP